MKSVYKHLTERSAPINKVEPYLSNILIAYIREEKIEKVQEELDKGADVNADYGNGWTPLHYASRQPNAEIVQLLIDNEAKLDNKTNIGDTPLHLACKNTQDKIILLLVKNGADVEAINHMNELPIYLYKKYVEMKKSNLNDAVMDALS